MKEQKQTSSAVPPWLKLLVKVIPMFFILWFVKTLMDFFHITPVFLTNATTQITNITSEITGIFGLVFITLVPLLIFSLIVLKSYSEAKEASCITKIVHILTGLLLPFFIVASFISTPTLIIFVCIGELDTTAGSWVLFAFCLSVGGTLLMRLLRHIIREKMLQKKIDFLHKTNSAAYHSIQAIQNKRETLNDLLAIVPYPDIKIYIDDFDERAERLIKEEPKLKKAFDKATEWNREYWANINFLQILAEYKSGTLKGENAVYALTLNLLTDKKQLIEILQKNKPACPRALELLQSPTYNKDDTEMVDDLITLLEVEK